MFTVPCAKEVGVHLEPKMPLEGSLWRGAHRLHRGPLQDISGRQGLRPQLGAEEPRWRRRDDLKV